MNNTCDISIARSFSIVKHQNREKRRKGGWKRRLSFFKEVRDMPKTKICISNTYNIAYDF